MTDLRLALTELIRKGDISNLDFLREGVAIIARALMEMEVAQKTGAELGERTPDRRNYRNGYRNRAWDTRVGRIDLRISKLRHGSYLPSLIEPRRRAERAVVAVVQEAYVQGVSTRKVDDLVQALGMTGISKSEVSRICAELDEAVQAFLKRPLTSTYAYLWLDAKYIKVREGGRVVNMALVIAVGVSLIGGVIALEPFYTT